MIKIFLSILIGSTLIASMKPALAEVLVFSAIAETPLRQPIIEIMTEVYNRLGIKTKIVELPANRAIYEANRGEYDGELFRIKGVENKYPNLVRVETPCHFMEKYAFVRAENKFEVDGWESIPKHFIVGTFFGLLYQEREINKYNLKAEYVRDIESNFNMLALKRVDVVISSKNIAETTIKKLNLKNIVRLEPALQRIESFHYLHKKNERLVPEVNKILIELTNDNFITEILEKYESLR